MRVRVSVNTAKGVPFRLFGRNILRSTELSTIKLLLCVGDEYDSVPFHKVALLRRRAGDRRRSQTVSVPQVVINLAIGVITGLEFPEGL